VERALIATVLFFAVTLALVLVWRALFRPVPWRVVFGIWLAISIYQGETLFSGRIDVPARFAYHLQPWKSLHRQPVMVNTGLALREMIPWTNTAREILKSGEAPLWNRTLGGGTPLLSDQQSSIAHPFTLLGLYLPIGKAWTLSVALRLFFALFFMFVLLKNWELHDLAALFGAIAYGFSTFHLVTLLMPLGLTIMMMPMTLATTDELMRRPRLRSCVFVVAALAMTVLAGHPEAELWVGLATGAYALYLAIALRNARPLVPAAVAAITAVLLTAFFWWPTAALVKQSNRYHVMTRFLAQPLEHHLGAQWFIVFVSPNILGTIPTGTYRPPQPQAADLLDDYGEVACGYAGIITLVLAAAALPFAWRRRPGVFAIGLIVVALLMITEAPGWHALIQKIPLVNVSLHQRFRVFWNLGVVLLAAIGLDAWLRGELAQRRIVLGTIAVAAVLAGVLAFWLPPILPRVSSFEIVQIVGPLALLLAVPFLAQWRRFAVAVTLLTFFELVMTTWRQNPPSAPEDLFPVTGAIAAMLSDVGPYRIVARGDAFLPDMPGFYGLEDVKSTSPFSTFEYLHLFRGWFAPAGFDQIVGTTHYPYADFLGVRYIYVPPGQNPGRDDVREIYRGADGAVFRNDKALPRYFFPRHFDVELDFGNANARTKGIADFRAEALIDHIPAKVHRLAPALSPDMQGGELRIVRYGPNSTDLDVVSHGWNLLASSDAFFPGWRAYWNGQRMPIVRVNGAFVGMFVPPGKGRVRFRYRPKEFDDGLAIGAATFVVLIAAMGIHVRLRKRRIASPAQSADAA
jgi:hypothetical protein